LGGQFNPVKSGKEQWFLYPMNILEFSFDLFNQNAPFLFKTWREIKSASV
jgi:hypothetical protein